MDLLPFMGFDFNHKNSQGKIRFKFQNMFQGKSIQPSQTHTKLTLIGMTRTDFWKNHPKNFSELI